MKFNKRLLSFFLAVLMLVSTFSGSVFAESNDLKTQDANTESSVTATVLEGKVDGNKEIFTFELPERQARRRVRRAAPLNQGNDTIVNLTAIGLNGGEFDWTSLPSSEFKLTAKWKTADGQEHSKVFATISAAGETQHYVGWPINGTLDKTASIEADFDQNIKIRVTYDSGDSNGIPGGLLFNITIKELAEPRADVKYVDPYGRDLEKEDRPAADAAMPNVTADELTGGVAIALPKSNGQINMREDAKKIDEDELNAAAKGLSYKVDGKTTGETVTIGGKDYKLDISQPNAKEVATIILAYQKDVVIPPYKGDGSGEPVKVADGYVRVTFDPTPEAQDKTKTYYDVKNTLTWAQATADTITPHVAEPQPNPTPNNDKKVFDAWLDNTAAEGSKKLSEKSGKVGTNPVTFKAHYSDKIIVNPDEDKKPTDKTHVKLTFQANNDAEGIADGKVLVDGTEAKNPTEVYVAIGTKWDDDDLTKQLAKIKAESAAGKKTFVEWQDAQGKAIPATKTDVAAKDFKAHYSAGVSTKPAAPTVDDITEGDDSIKVKTPTDGDRVIVEIPDPTPQDPNHTKEKEVKKNPNNKWTVDGSEIKEENGKLIIPVKPEDITKDKEIKVVVKDSTKTTNNVSDPTIKPVKAKGTPTPTYNYITLTLDENYRGGRVSDYDVYQYDLIERYLYVPHRRGYVFEGWSYNSRRLDEVRPGDRIEYSTTLYAIWSKQKAKDDEEVEPIDTREVGEHKAYMFGYTDGTVRPNGYITRAEAAALVTRLLGLDTFASAAEPAFTDTPSSWYNKAINAAVNRGIMKGYPDGSFRPNAPITRAEFTQMISTIDNKPYGVAPFADVKGHWAERPIGSEYQAGRIMGYPDGTFRPNAFITRAEAVVILNKIFERNYDAMSAINAKNKESIKRFIDLTPSFWGFNDMVEATNTHLFMRRVPGRVEEDWVEVK